MDSPAGQSLLRKLVNMDASLPDDSDQKHEERSEYPLLMGVPRPPGLTEAQWAIIQAEQSLLDSDRLLRDSEEQRRLNAPLRRPLDATFSEFDKGARRGRGRFLKKRQFIDNSIWKGND